MILVLVVVMVLFMVLVLVLVLVLVVVLVVLVVTGVVSLGTLVHSPYLTTDTFSPVRRGGGGWVVLKLDHQSWRFPSSWESRGCTVRRNTRRYLSFMTAGRVEAQDRTEHRGPD